MNAPFRALATFSNAEFERLVRSGGLGDKRVELRRGLITEMSPQFYRHGHVKAELGFALAAAISAAGLSWRVFNEVSVAFDGGFEPMPDIVVFDPADIPADLTGPLPAKAVRLVVEVSDTTLTDDLGEKLEDYAGARVAEYWVTDVNGRLILRHADPQAIGYARREAVLFGGVAASLTRPELCVDTSKL